MLPNYEDYYEEDEEENEIIDETEEPNKTYKLDNETLRIIGTVDGIEAIRQAVEKELNTELYEDIIYDFEYGIQKNDLFGRDMDYVGAMIEHRIKEALLMDERIEEVEGFQFVQQKGKLLVSFIVVSNLGEIEVETEVDV